MSFKARRDGIYGSMRMVSERQDAAFDLIRLAENRPRFDQPPVEGIRAQLLSEIIANEREPHAIAEVAWRRRLLAPIRIRGRPRAPRKAWPA
ncbi:MULTISPECIES: hypothetical protein [unclassified Mesorhizobium]|uniref:hypothetical protein n=1 Tax=unclassified Mesorhizobium TaxID=325217 RepID=UPI001938526E|nr:hypothetical protein MesoLj131a_61680 [Mesorhizobium sp. 131-2-1]BCH04375.1 hypothetical protein MesoLj131b_63740 [Mesorhizobium sp. 131-2-5]